MPVLKARWVPGEGDKMYLVEMLMNVVGGK